MKVLMLGWELPPHYAGGMGLVCDQLTRQMAKHGADIEFILPFTADYSHITHMKVTPADGQDAYSLMSSGGTYDSMSYQVTSSSGETSVNNLYQQVHYYTNHVQKLAKLGEYDVIHAHDWLTIKAGISAKLATGLPLFVHIHATEYDRAGGKFGNPLIRDIEYAGLHMADHIFAVSSYTKDVLVREYHLPADKITVTENVMDVPLKLIEEDHTSYAYLEKLKSSGYSVVLNAGRMTIQKGIYHLLNAAKIVIEKNPKTIFFLVGGGEQINELLEHAAELGIGRNVIFTGRIEGIGKQWRDAFRVSDLFVMPSVSEPLGMVPYEATAYGVPSLVSKQSGIVEYFTNCLKVDYWDSREMANQICSVLDNRCLHDELLSNAQVEKETKSWEPISERIMSKYSTHCEAVAAI